ncbi:MAG: DUF1257 domain-containing protein [Planctomycetes bacterium]|nr:DUF1257 domain-containing protein [Planctomycetota bacterium]
MGAIIVLTPVMAAAWPVVSASVLGAAAALGFAQGAGARTEAARATCVDLEVAGARAVTDDLSADQHLSFARDGVTVTFGRDARGECGVRVIGTGKSREELGAIGTEFAEQVVQQYAYHRLMEELGRQNFAVVSQEMGEDRTIHVQVRRFV